MITNHLLTSDHNSVSQTVGVSLTSDFMLLLHNDKSLKYIIFTMQITLMLYPIVNAIALKVS